MAGVCCVLGGAKVLFNTTEVARHVSNVIAPVVGLVSPLLLPVEPYWAIARKETNGVIDIDSPVLLITLSLIVLAPLIWNTLARLEYYTHILTKIFFGNKYWGCYALALWIFFFSLYRDFWYFELLETQPQWQLLLPSRPILQLISAFLFLTGSFLVLSSFFALGITGTYLGDYFGILLTERVTGFPFNVTNNPMYNGSSIIFLSHALNRCSAAGLLVSVFVFVVYRIALLFEEPFTTKIYARAQHQKTR